MHMRRSPLAAGLTSLAIAATVAGGLRLSFLMVEDGKFEQVGHSPDLPK
jgi:hypothetical protein